MRFSDAIDVRLGNERVKELRLGGNVIHRNYLYLRDEFDGDALDATRWDTVNTIGTGTIDVVNGSLVITDGDEVVHDGEMGTFFTGIVSKLAFPVGTRYRARARNPVGRHAALIGFANAPTAPHQHESVDPGMSWYSRADIPDNIVASYTDEVGAVHDLSRANSHADWVVLEIRRVSDTTVEFYENDVLVHTQDSLVFANDYKVFFGCDSWSPTTTMEVDWVEVIGPFNPTVT